MPGCPGNLGACQLLAWQPEVPITVKTALESQSWGQQTWGLCPGRTGNPGRGMVGRQTHPCSPGRWSAQSIPDWEMETPARNHMLTLCPFYTEQNSLLWSMESTSPAGDTPDCRGSALGGGSVTPPCPLHPLLGSWWTHTGVGSYTSISKGTYLILIWHFPGYILPWIFFF